MAIKIGNTNIGKAYLGGTEIKKLYLGAVLILNNLLTAFKTRVNNDSGTIEAEDCLDTFANELDTADIEYALVASAYKENKIYSLIKNESAFDYNFTRNTTATRLNEDRNIEIVGNNIPRLDYQTAGCPSLLFEPQRTNLFPDSEPGEPLPYSNTRSAQFMTNYDWNLGSDFSDNAIFFEGNNTISIRYFYFDLPTPVENTTIFFTFYMRFVNGQAPIFGGSTSSGGSNITIIGINANNITSVLVKDDIYRVTAKRVVTSPRTRIGGPALYQNNVEHRTSFYLSGIQMEEGDFATSYIPTNGSIATRNADDIGIKIFPNTLIEKGDDFEVNMEAELLNPEANDLYGRGGSILFSLFEAGISAFQNQITLCRRSGQFFIKCRSAESGIDVNYLTGINFNANQKYKIKFEYNNAGGVKLTINGTEVFENTDTLPELKINKGLFTAYDNTTPFSKIYNFSIKNK